MAETIWPTEPEIFGIWPFPENIGQPLGWTLHVSLYILVSLPTVWSQHNFVRDMFSAFILLLLALSRGSLSHSE